MLKTEEEIKLWVAQNNDGLLNGMEEVHVALCLHKITLWYWTGLALGGFLTAVAQDSLSRAIGHADDINRKAIYLYPMFLHWNLPSDYIKKAKGEK